MDLQPFGNSARNMRGAHAVALLCTDSQELPNHAERIFDDLVVRLRAKR
jgi:hypothetical protein